MLRDLWERLKGKGPAAAVALSLDLGDTRDNLQVSLEAGGLIVERCDGDLLCKVNSPNGDALNLRYVRRILYPVQTLYFSNSAQSGKSAKILVLPVGMEAIGDVEIPVAGAYLAPTALGAGGTATIWTPGSGKAIKLKRFSFSVDATTRVDLRWGASAFESFFMGTNSSVICNLRGCNEQGPKDTALVIASSGAATVTARASGEEI